MGIPGLLKMLKPYTQPVHVNKYSGKRVGIDAYCWLHKGAYACSFGVCEGDQKISSMQPCIKYCMHHINLLRFNNVIPVVVFDGGRLPLKAFTENQRQRRRDLNLEQARSKLSEGDVNGAQELCQRAVEITPLMAHEFVKVLKTEGVEFVVAPYEADAQLAYLSSLSPEKGGVAAVISEDSDLLAYGCSVVMYKMDRYGNGEEVRLKDVMRKRTQSEGPSNSLWFGCLTPELFTGMCVLAGCDFLPSVPGIGIKRAHCLVCKYRDLARVLSSMRFDRKLVVPEGYELAFKQANAIFHHARIYDASARKLSFLKPLPGSFVNEFNGDLDFLGPDLPPSRALAIAQGRLDPISMCAFNEFVCKEPSSPQHTVTEPKLTAGESSDRRCFKQLMQGDVWLGTDEELLSLLAVGGPKLPLSFSPMSECASPRSVPPDSGFLVHLTSISNRKAVVQPLEEQQPPANRTGVVVLSPGKKRVLIPPPNNNPFKRVKLYDTSSGFSSETSFLFDTLPDERASCRDKCLEKLSSTPQHACHDTGQVNQVKREAQISSATGCTVDNYGNCGLICMKAVNSQDLVREESMTEAPLPAQDLERVMDINNSASDVQVLKEPERSGDAQVPMQSKVYTAASLPADGFGIKPVQGRCTRSATTSIHPDSELSMSPVLQNASAQQSSLKSNPISTAHNMVLPSASHPVKAGVESSKTSTFIRHTQRELKSEKGIRSSSKQSSKAVMVASTPSLLKFFQRAPTL